MKIIIIFSIIWKNKRPYTFFPCCLSSHNQLLLLFTCKKKKKKIHDRSKITRFLERKKLTKKEVIEDKPKKEKEEEEWKKKKKERERGLWKWNKIKKILYMQIEV